MDVKTKLTKARIALLTTQPFWGTLALRLQLVACPEIPTLAVDGRRIFYNPGFIESLSHHLVMSAIAHEVSHCVFEHIARRGDRNPMKFNIAGDYVINLGLKEADFELGDGWLIDDQYKGMTTDQVYNLLPNPPPGQSQPGIGEPGGALCDIMDGETKADPALQDDWKIAAAQAANQAQQAGKLPDSMRRLIDDLLNPKTDWRTQLRRFITETSKADYSWARPQKKMLAHGLYLPSLYSERMRELVIAIDTSGSITQHMLNIFGAEVEAVRSAVQPEITRIIYCDAAINRVDEFPMEALLELEMVGGGGTDFNPPFNYLEEHGITPSAFLYFTDLYGPAPTAPPSYPALWCCTTTQQEPWGERIQVDVDE